MATIKDALGGTVFVAAIGSMSVAIAGDRLGDALVDVWDRLGLVRVDQVLAAE